MIATLIQVAKEMVPMWKSVNGTKSRLSCTYRSMELE